MGLFDCCEAAETGLSHVLFDIFCSTIDMLSGRVLVWGVWGWLIDKLAKLLDIETMSLIEDIDENGLENITSNSFGECIFAEKSSKQLFSL